MCYRVKMLPTGHAVYVDTSFSQDGQCCLARGVFLSQYSRARCNVPSKVLAIAHATMTLLLVAPLRLSFKDKRKESIPLHESASKTSKFGDELERASFCMLRAIAASLQVMRGSKLCDLLCSKAESVELFIVAPPIVVKVLLILLLFFNQFVVLFVPAVTLLVI